MNERIINIVKTAEAVIYAQTKQRVTLVAYDTRPANIYPPFTEYGEAVRRAACGVAKIPESVISEKNRAINVVMVRHLIAYFMKTRYDKKISLLQMAKFTGHTDHTSVLHSYNTAVKLLSTGHYLFTALYHATLEILGDE